jgi:retinol dehydrogenase-12
MLTERSHYSPSDFIISDEGEVAQKQIWRETIALLKKEAPETDISFFDN